MSSLPKPAPGHGLALEITYPRTGLLRPGARNLKRILDVSAATLVGLAAAPLALAISLAIAFESRGPILFSQVRIGRGGRRFRIWKFRSMAVDADEMLQERLERNHADALEWLMTHKLRNDPRVTRVGRLLRRTSLDELPQLWNVLRGDMSMVGPRPIVEEEIPKYGAALALYTQVRPGLTGLWQVSGRNDTTYRERVDLDCRYIRTWTLLEDLHVALRTVRVVMDGQGAY